MDNLLVRQIETRLFKIFKSRFNIDFYELGEEYFCKDLLGEDFKLAARDLLYVYFDIKQEFSILIPDEDVSEGKFSTLTGLLEIVNKQMKYKEN